MEQPVHRGAGEQRVLEQRGPLLHVTTGRGDRGAMPVALADGLVESSGSSRDASARSPWPSASGWARGSDVICSTTAAGGGSAHRRSRSTATARARAAISRSPSDARRQRTARDSSHVAAQRSDRCSISGRNLSQEMGAITSASGPSERPRWPARAPSRPPRRQGSTRGSPSWASRCDAASDGEGSATGHQDFVPGRGSGRSSPVHRRRALEPPVDV